MARIRAVSIRNFRGVASLDWVPSPGLNCLIGPGDTGKSTILDAIDLCVGARRSAQFSDADFHGLDTNRPILIAVTLGDLPSAIRSMEVYGLYLRGFDPASGAIHDEPGARLETALTLTLTVGPDLEPVWSLHSDRAVAQGQGRNLIWSDRLSLAPVHIAGSGDEHLAWRRGSVLNRISDQAPDATAALVKAARDAREAFGVEAEGQLAGTLAVVNDVALKLGVPLKGGAKAFLDARSISFSRGIVSLHDADGVPLAGLGTGSSRLLIAGIQRVAAPQASVALVDEIEHGLEPHRVIGLLGSLGAKETIPPLQVLATTHSPVVVRELAAAQLFLVRTHQNGIHSVRCAGEAGDVQGVLRLFPEAFLARKVIVCEGASEVGLLRGLDRYFAGLGLDLPLTAKGVALVDAGGAEKLFDRANAFVALGYDTLAFRDDDLQPTPDLEQAFLAASGKLVKWRSGNALEDELFQSLPDDAITELVERAIELRGEALVDAHLKSASENRLGLHDLDALRLSVNRPIVARASKARKGGWFKSLTCMEDVGADIVGPHLTNADPGFERIVADLYGWMG